MIQQNPFIPSKKSFFYCQILKFCKKKTIREGNIKGKIDIISYFLQTTHILGIFYDET